MGGGVWAGGEAALRAAGRGGGRRRPGQVPGGGVAPERLGEGGGRADGGWWADGAAARAAGRGGGRRGGDGGRGAEAENASAMGLGEIAESDK